MKIIKKSRLINLVILFTVFLNTVSVYPIDNQTSQENQKTENNKQYEKNKESKNNKQTNDQKQTSKINPIVVILLILASTQIILPAVEIIGIVADNISELYRDYPLFSKKCTNKNSFKKTLIISVAIIGTIVLFYLLFKKRNSNNNYYRKAGKWPIKEEPSETKYFAKTEEKPSSIPAECQKLNPEILCKDKATVKIMVNNDSNILGKKSNNQQSIDIAYKKQKTDIVKRLKMDGGPFVYHRMCPRPKLFTPLLEFRVSIDPKWLSYCGGERYNKECLIDRLIEIINDEKTIKYEKQSALFYLLLEHKNFNKQIDQNQINKLISKIKFNHRFFKSKKFREILDIAIKNNLKDVFGNSILMASVKFSKDHNLVFKHIMETYEKYSYPKNQAEKDKLKKEVKLYLKNAGKSNRKLYHKMRNIDLMWCDLGYKNLLSKTKPQNKEGLEAECVKNIIEFIGIDGIKSDKIYFK